MSSNPESSKTLAAVGALLLFLSSVPGAGIIGIILLFIGLKGLSEYYQDESIFSNALRGLIFGIIGVIGVTAFTVLLGFTGAILFGPFVAIGLLIGIIAALAIAFVFYLLMAMNLRRVFDTLAQRSGEPRFRTAGNLLWWGAILTIIVVGLVLIWIAWIFLAIALFSMRLSPQPYGEKQYGYTPPPPPASAAQEAEAGKFCPNCGAPVQPNTVFCPNCGKQLPT